MMKDLNITIVCGPADHTGTDHQITLQVLGGGAPGFAPSAAQLSKLSVIIQKFADAVDNNLTPL